MNNTSTSPRRGVALGYACILLSTLLFSSMEIALKTVSGRFNPLQLNFLRFLVGSLFLLPFALRSLKRRGAAIGARDWGFFALAGFACVVASMTLYQLAIEYCTASVVAILFSCNPVFVIPLAAIFLKERIRGFTAASMALSVAGMFCIMNPWGVGAKASTAGIALTLGSAAVFAVYGVMSKTRSGRLGGLAVTAFSFLAGSAELLVLIFASRAPLVSASLETAGLGRFANIPILAGLDLDVAPTLAYVSFCVTGLGYAAYLTAIEKTSAQAASLIFYIKPALASVLAILVLGESIAPSTVAGIVLIAVGSAISFSGSIRSSPAR
jgi:drug/metabolite transporter (DMT)-like permease